jgi:transposase
MFSNTAKGAEASAVLYSVIETAKSIVLIPFDYLHHILKELGEGKTSTEDLPELSRSNINCLLFSSANIT